MFNGANTGFMLLAASLVMLMTPGLAFFYGGLVGRSSTLTIMIQSFASMGITTVLWWLVGYSLCFSGGADGIYGNFDLAFLRHVSRALDVRSPREIPLVVLIAYQMMFAIITPALITGAFTNRVTFKAYLIFLVVWQLFVYYPFVHMIWGGGLLAQWGVRDFAGGIVVHATRRLRRARLGAVRRSAQGSSTRRTTSRSSPSAPGCSGSAGTASTPAAS